MSYKGEYATIITQMGGVNLPGIQSIQDLGFNYLVKKFEVFRVSGLTIQIRTQRSKMKFRSIHLWQLFQHGLQWTKKYYSAITLFTHFVDNLFSLLTGTAHLMIDPIRLVKERRDRRDNEKRYKIKQKLNKKEYHLIEPHRMFINANAAVTNGQASQGLYIFKRVQNQ